MGPSYGPFDVRAGRSGRPSFTEVLRRSVQRTGRMLHTLREVFYGFTGYEFEQHAAHARADLENLFTFMVMGDLIGVPVLPPYYALRLVPYLLEGMPAWRRRVLRERQPLEGDNYDLHGV